MKSGCLSLLAIWIGATAFYGWQLHGTQFEWWVWVLLGLGITLVALNVWGLAVALQKAAAAKRPPESWRDGDFVAVSGKLSTLSKPVIAPVSGREVVVAEYEIKRIIRSDDSKREEIDVTGFHMAPCAIQGARGAVRLHGYPLMIRFTEEWFDEPENRLQVAKHLLSASLQEMRAGALQSLRQLGDILADEDGDVNTDLVSPKGDPELRASLAGRLGAPVAVSPADNDEPTPEMRELAATLERFAMSERVIPCGMEVTAFGTYRAQHRAVDIGSGMTKLKHSLEAGSLKSTTRKALRGSAIAIVVFGVATVVGHYFVFEPVRLVIDEWIGSLRASLHSHQLVN